MLSFLVPASRITISNALAGFAPPSQSIRITLDTPDKSTSGLCRSRKEEIDIARKMAIQEQKKSRMHCWLLFCWTVIALLQDPCHAWAPKLIGVHSNQPRSVAETDERIRLFSQSHSRRRSTELAMGLRSFIGRRIKRRNNDDDDDSNENDKTIPNEENLKTPIVDVTNGEVFNDMEASSEPLSNTDKVIEETSVIGAAEDKPSMRPPPVRMGEDPASKEINVFPLDKRESAQDRINRVKSGQMTDEEKAAYLRTALSAGSGISRPPLKPKSTQLEDDLKSKASPFPGDPIYRSIAGGKQVEPAKLTNELVDRVGLDMQKKKRDYLDMVTDPHRFDVYRNSASRLPKEKGDDSVNPPPSAAPMPSDLGERLGAAASAAEEQRKKKLAMEAQKREEEAKRQAEVAKRMQEDQRRRQEEMAKRLREKKEQEEELAAQEQARAQQKRKEQQEAMMKAQEEYWAKKLAAERQAKQKESEKVQRQTLPDAGLNRSDVNGASEKKETVNSYESAAATPMESSAVSEDDVTGADSSPVEATAIVEEPPQNKPAQKSENIPQTTSPNTVPTRFSPSDLNDVKTLNRNAPNNVSGPGTRNTQKDKMVDEQIRRLKELNSPLPSSRATAGGRPGNTVRRAAPFEPQRPAGARFEPQRPASANPASSSASSASGSQANNPRSSSGSVNDLLNGYSRQTTSNPAPPPPKPSAFDDVSNLNSNPAPSPRSSVPTPPKEAAPVEATNPIARMFGGVSPKDNGMKDSRKPTQQPKVSPKVSPPPTPKRTGPIRMQLPLDDDDDYDEDEEGVNSKANPGMSIAEALKRTTEGGSVDQEERSKKWGIDMSKFQ